MSTTHYDHLKVPQLKAILKDRDLNPTGKKTELIDRLKEHDVQLKRNEGFILLFCKTMIGSYYDIWIKRYDGVRFLKDILSERTGTPVNKLVLECDQNGNRVRMDDTAMIADYNLFHESTVFIILRL